MCAWVNPTSSGAQNDMIYSEDFDSSSGLGGAIYIQTGTGQFRGWGQDASWVVNSTTVVPNNKWSFGCTTI
jgi:hypothetical protein